MSAESSRPYPLGAGEFFVRLLRGNILEPVLAAGRVPTAVAVPLYIDDTGASRSDTRARARRLKRIKVSTSSSSLHPTAVGSRSAQRNRVQESPISRRRSGARKGARRSIIAQPAQPSCGNRDDNGRISDLRNRFDRTGRPRRGAVPIARNTTPDKSRASTPSPPWQSDRRVPWPAEVSSAAASRPDRQRAAQLQGQYTPRISRPISTCLQVRYACACDLTDMARAYVDLVGSSDWQALERSRPGPDRGCGQSRCLWRGARARSKRSSPPSTVLFRCDRSMPALRAAVQTATSSAQRALSGAAPLMSAIAMPVTSLACSRNGSCLPRPTEALPRPSISTRNNRSAPTQRDSIVKRILQEFVYAPQL